MKKITTLAAIAAVAGLASCTAQAPKANLKTELDSLSYSIGMAQTQGLKAVKKKLLTWQVSRSVSRSATR